MSFVHLHEDKSAGLAALDRTPQRHQMLVDFSPTTEDRLESLRDVLENLPPAKPTKASIRVQLCAPLLLGAKGLYDAIAAMAEMIKDGKVSAKQIVMFALGIFFVTIAAWAWGTLKQSYNDALAKTDPHHKRVLNRIIRELEGLPAAPDAHNTGKLQEKETDQ